MADWAELPRDMLALITSFLSLADTLCFSAVCQNWCSVAKEERHRPVPQLPLLVLPDDETTRKRRFYNMSENTYYHFSIPELRHAFIMGSSFGWLFAVGRRRSDAYLVNPFSGAKFYLPSLPIIYHWWYRPKKLVELVLKAVISSDPSIYTDFVVLILLAGSNELALYKPGDTTWTLFDCGEDAVFDIVCFKGQFYALLEGYVLASVDIDPEPTIRPIEQCADPDPQPDYDWLTYLVNYNDTSLLLVFQWKGDFDRCITSTFSVLEIDMESYKIRLLADIDGHALFLGLNESIVVRASDINGCMANSIYFYDVADLGMSEKLCGFGMGVYNLRIVVKSSCFRAILTTLPDHVLFGCFLTQFEESPQLGNSGTRAYFTLFCSELAESWRFGRNQTSKRINHEGSRHMIEHEYLIPVKMGEITCSFTYLGSHNHV